MDRRSFLRSILAASVAPIDIDRLLWVPGKKTIFIPPAELIRPTMITLEEWMVAATPNPALQAIVADIARFDEFSGLSARFSSLSNDINQNTAYYERRF